MTTIDTTTGTQIGTTLALTGELSSLPLSADGTRALIKTIVTDPATGTNNTWVAVINTATGTQIGTTLAVTGYALWPLLSADGTRALITTDASGTTRVAVLRIV